MNARGEFSSRLGFVLAAAGSAVGLGNIWGFPTQVASNGGAAFVLAYIVLAFLLAYPVLMAELIIGRATRSNMVSALGKISGNFTGKATGIWGFVTVSLILSFYALVAGWMLSHFVQTITDMLRQESWSTWLVTSSVTRDVVFSAIFLTLTALIVTGGVSKGIEKWSVRLMPALFIIIGLLIAYVSMLDGASDGWSAYVLPNFSLLMDPELLVDAMGQAFFSMSLGVGTMLVYGSYVSQKENLPTLGASVALVDIGVAVLAGMLIIPAMYVALHNGIEIFTESGDLIEGPNLIFAVLPSLFESMGSIGVYIAFVFFALMLIAALTSSISMLEVPVAYVVESHEIERKPAVWILTVIVFLISSTIALNFEQLFGLVIDLTTKYSQPLLGLVLCIFAGWVWKRNEILKELLQGNENAEQGIFWKVWPWYVKFVCPVVIAVMFYFKIAS
ncbi:sodium-dependent transporter [Paraglaciecola sp.]|uniref:sodium-dependent transporter n=1 Tax=Paraglaciecola sp. TaxID=1920173 RepID=UPI003EF81C17